MDKVILKNCVILITATLFLLFISVVSVKAQLPVPVLNCVSAEDDGSLSVSWSIPSGTFDGFRIFYKRTSDPFSNSADAINSISSIILPVTDAQSIGYEIYMVTINYGPPIVLSAESNHLRSMVLTVSNAGTGAGIARLDWNRIQAGNNGVFNIYRKELTGIFSPIGQSNSNFFTDTISSPYCSATDLYYRVEFSSGSCVANSSTASGSFSDDNVPDDPTLSFVTINAGIAEVNWTHSPTNDVKGYVIGVKEGANFNDHYTVGYTTLFQDNQNALPTYHDPCLEVVTYVIRAEDLCDNQSSGAINYQFPHNTILLTGETQSLCNRKATLTWNAYINMVPPVSEYSVMRTHNGSAPAEIANIAATADQQYSYIDTELLTPNDIYTYTIAAGNGDNSKISGSCTIQLVPDPEPFSLFEMDYLSVVNNDHIELFVSGEPPSLIDSVEIWRSSVDGSSVELLFTESWNGVSPVSISDASALVNEASYYYYVKALDACSFELGSTNISRSILLQIQDIGNDEYRLGWNAYEDWGADLLEYNVFRMADGVVEAGFPFMVPPSQLTFNDMAGNLVASRTTYYVEAVRNDDTRSRSNEVLLPADAEVIIPNAFRPGGISPLFKPRIKNIEQGSYLFAVYNRWGQLVYSTGNPLEGWNGQLNGAQASQDIYAWIVTFTDLTGKKSSKRGTVMLLR